MNLFKLSLTIGTAFILFVGGRAEGEGGFSKIPLPELPPVASEERGVPYFPVGTAPTADAAPAGAAPAATTPAAGLHIKEVSTAVKLEPNDNDYETSKTRAEVAYYGYGGCLEAINYAANFCKKY